MAKEEEPRDFIILENKKREIIPALLQACPSFQNPWEEHVQSWQGKEAGIYNDLAEFVHHVVALYKKNETEEVGRAFHVVEDFLREGRQDVKEAVAVGFLETLQCTASWESFGSAAFEKWLGPVSRRWWDELEEIWRGKSSLMDVVRDETGSNSIKAKPILPED